VDIVITPVNRIFQTYQNQARIAELNKKHAVKTVQGQRDQVTISKEALRLLAEGRPQPGPKPTAEPPYTAHAASAPPESNPVPETGGDFQPFDFSSPEFQGV